LEVQGDFLLNEHRERGFYYSLISRVEKGQTELEVEIFIQGLKEGNGILHFIKSELGWRLKVFVIFI